jgi:hypothetical protein
LRRAEIVAARPQMLAPPRAAWHTPDMPLPRRILLAAPLLIAARAAPRKAAASALRLRPGGGPVTCHLAVEPIASRLTFTGFHESFVLPGEAVILGTYPVAGRELLSVGFDASALAGVSQKLAALVGWDGKTLRILDVETLSFASSDNGSQSSLTAHLAAGDRDHLRFSVEASRSEHQKAPRHEAWTDLLAWHEGAPLATAPQAKPAAHPAGPWQARCEATRARIAALLTPPRTQLTLDMLDPTGLLDPLGSAAK